MLTTYLLTTYMLTTYVLTVCCIANLYFQYHSVHSKESLTCCHRDMRDMQSGVTRRFGSRLQEGNTRHIFPYQLRCVCVWCLTDLQLQVIVQV